MEHFKQMYDLERLYYEDEYITPPQEAYAWYERYSYTTVAAAVGDRIVGFINLFPITTKVFNAIMTGDYNDKYLTVDDVVDINDKECTSLNMFLSCIVVKEDYRKRGLTTELLKTAVEQYVDVMHKCKWIITDNSTPEGAAFSERYGFIFERHSKHNSKIYLQPFKNLKRFIK